MQLLFAIFAYILGVLSCIVAQAWLDYRATCERNPFARHTFGKGWVKTILK